MDEGFKSIDSACKVGVPVPDEGTETTTMHLPKKALRRGAWKRSIEVWQPLSVPRILAPPVVENSIWFSAQGQRLPSLSTTSTVMNVVVLPL